jgi:hypothetical protein
MPKRIYLNFNLRTVASTDVMRKEHEHVIEQVTCVPKVNYKIVLEVIKFYLPLTIKLPFPVAARSTAARLLQSWV